MLPSWCCFVKLDPYLEDRNVISTFNCLSGMKMNAPSNRERFDDDMRQIGIFVTVITNTACVYTIIISTIKLIALGEG